LHAAGHVANPPQCLTSPKLFVEAQLLLQRVLDRRLRGIVGPFSLLTLLEVDNLGRIAAVALDETAPMRDLVGQGGHFSPVRFQQLFQLGDPRRLLRVKVAGVVDRLFGGVALLYIRVVRVSGRLRQQRVATYEMTLEHLDLLSQQRGLRRVDPRLLLGRSQLLLCLFQLGVDFR
jgi:hypothetical protein